MDESYILSSAYVPARGDINSAGIANIKVVNAKETKLLFSKSLQENKR